MQPDLSDALSTLADRYAIEREIGRGSSALVYLAHDLKHDRKVAIKVLVPELSRAVSSGRFLREIATAAKLNHPHILPLLDSGNANGMLYYVMPFVDGESLRSRLERAKQLPVKDALRITREVAEALNYAHENGVVHRDIKPENILLQAGQAVVADFGIARALTATTGQTATEAALAVGTPAYMSPEQADGGAVDGRTDIYSLGCVLYEMLVGHPPFSGATSQEILTRHILDPLPSLRAARAGLPATLERSLSRALAKQPADRFDTAEQFSSSLEASGATTQPRRRAILYAGAAVSTLGAVAIALAALRWGPATSPAEKSIAVLPFVNISGDSAQESFSEGMTEELINALSRIDGLRVPGRTSSYAFQGKEVALKRIGNALNVGTVLEGTVRTAGSRLRVSARLVNVADGYQVWSDIYERDMKDVFAVQDEITLAIVSALQVKLAPAQSRPENLAAYELYLKGRYFWNKGTGAGFDRAREFFSAAIAQDPNYALAYAGLADAYERLLNGRFLTRAEAYPRARAAARRAIELDPQLPEAYIARAQIRYRHEWDWPGAEEDFRRAVALNPGAALGHLWYGLFLVQRGRTADAIREASRAAEIDPLSVQVRTNFATLLYYARRFEEAADQARKALDLEPNSAEAHARLADGFLMQKRFADATREFETALDLLGGRGRVTGLQVRLGFSYARAGQRQKALDMLQALKERGAGGESAIPGYNVNVAYLHGELAQKDEAFELLEQAYREREWVLTTFRVNPLVDSLRSDPRFEPFLRKIGLDDR